MPKPVVFNLNSGSQRRFARAKMVRAPNCTSNFFRIAVSAAGRAIFSVIRVSLAKSGFAVLRNGLYPALILYLPPIFSPRCKIARHCRGAADGKSGQSVSFIHTQVPAGPARAHGRRKHRRNDKEEERKRRLEAAYVL
jgi:hypothetical protein